MLDRLAESNLLSGIEHVPQNDTSACLANVNWHRLRLGSRPSDLGLVGSGIRLVRSGELPHQSISAIIVEVHTCNIGVIEGTGTASPLVAITATRTVEVTARASGMRTASATAGECRSLEVGLALSLEALEQVGSGLWGELVVAQADADGTASEVETVHLL